jgi:hypothetical protein
MKNRILMAIMPVLACFALSPETQGQCVDGCDSIFGTFQGEGALISNSGGAGNSAFGWRALFSNAAGSFNTAVGGGALVINDGNSNTAVGAAALLLNTTGSSNTAVGTDAMVFNTVASNNNAVGAFALFNNDSSGNGFAGSNNAVGNSALSANVDGFANVAIGDTAMFSSNSNFNTAVGFDAGSNLTAAGFDENIYIGDTAGTLDFLGNPVGNESGVIRIGSFFAGTTACFINGILPHFIPLAPNNPIVTVDTTTGQLGWTMDFAANKVVEQQKQIEEQQASIRQLKSEMQTMVAQLREQATQIQKVSAQLEMSKPAAKVVVNKP